MSVAEPSIFGAIVTGADVEGWCLETLKQWSPTYLAELERQHGRTAGGLQPVRAWVTVPSLDKWPEDQLPAVLLLSVGIAAPPLKRGDGRYRARWQMGLACICSARTQALSHELSMLYLAAHRAILIQRPSLGGHAAGINWLDENYDELPLDDLRSLSAGQAIFTVEVEGVAGADAGPLTTDQPLTPDTDPWPDWPTVQTADVVVTKEGGTA